MTDAQCQHFLNNPVKLFTAETQRFFISPWYDACTYGTGRVYREYSLCERNKKILRLDQPGLSGPFQKGVKRPGKSLFFFELTGIRIDGGKRYAGGPGGP